MLGQNSRMADHPRLILRNFLQPEICQELEFIHKSCSAVGYRPNVFSTTLHHLIATNSAHLVMPLVPIRERLKEIVEEHFGCEYELFVEFTGLISWCKGASIGWHSDDNRDYLRQRDFAAVCYLNSYGVDFHGGLFHFQDGEPSTVTPMAGDVIIYTADDRNVHSVDEVVEGERMTLTLWFSRDAAYDEDVKILISLPDCLQNNCITSYVPALASINMYWFPPEEASRFGTGFEVCSARLHVLGFDVCSRDDECCLASVMDSSRSILELLSDPLYLACGNELLEYVFANILHALQVVQFYHWKVTKFDTDEPKGPIIVKSVSESQQKKIKYLKNGLIKDPQLAEELVGRTIDKSLRRTFGSFNFSAIVSEWEAYTAKLQKEMILSLPHWRKHQSIFTVSNLE